MTINNLDNRGGTIIEHVDTLYISAPTPYSLYLPEPSESIEECLTNTAQEVEIQQIDRTLEEESFAFRRFFEDGTDDPTAYRLISYLRNLWKEEHSPTACAYAIYAMNNYISSDVPARAKNDFFQAITGTQKSILHCFQTRFQQSDCFREKVLDQEAAVEAWLRQ